MAKGFSGRRLVAAALQTALSVTASVGGYAAISVARGLPAQALITPTAVTEFQPNLNASNSGAPSNHGKWGGRSTAVAVDPTTASTAIVGTESGGLFKTTDGGLTWSHLDGLAPFQIDDLRYAPNDHNTVLVTTWATSDSQNPGGVWRSTDGGATWSRPTLPAGYCGTNFFAWGLDFEPGTDTAYAGTDCGLLVSSNRGAIWTSVAEQRVHAVVASTGGVVDVCAQDGHRRYTNSGGNLTQVGGTSLFNGGGCPFLRGYDATTHNLTAAPNETNVLFAMSGIAPSTTTCGGSVANPAGRWGLFESDDSGVTWTQNGASCASREPWVRAVQSRDGVANHFDLYYSGGLDTTRVTCTTGGPGLRCAGLTTAPNVNTEHSDHNYVAFRPDGSNCPEFLVTDGGAQGTSDCGANFKMAAGSGSANGNFNALQVYEVNGQVHPGHTDLYFGTQDNDTWASPDNGASWPKAGCCEGFFFQTPYSTPSDSSQTLSFVACAGCNNLKSAAHFDGCNYNPACSRWPNPTGGSPGPDSGAPRVIQDQVYVQWTQPTAGNNQLNLTTNAGGGWSTVTNAATTTPLMSHPFVTGPTASPTIYQPVCTSSCGFIAPSGTILQITGARTSGATLTTAGSSLGSLGTYNDGIGSWLIQEAALGADPNNPNHLIAADVSTNKMKVSTDGGATWTVDQQLTNFVTGFGRYGFNIPVFGTQAHAIAFDPNNGNRIVVGTHEAGIIASTDGGATWTTILGSRQIPNVTDFFFDNVQNDIIVSSFGRGLWKLDMTPRPATLAYTGDTSGDYHDQVTLSAKLYDQAGGPSVPIQGATVNLTLGSQGCSNLTTDAGGRVSCSITLNQVPGSYSVVAAFAGNAQWSAVTTTTPFTIKREETTTTYTGPTVIANGFNVTLSGVLKEDGVVPIAGRSLTLTLGSGATAQSCLAMPTDATGSASCSLVVNQPLGAGTATARFLGDPFYLPSSDARATIMFGFPAFGDFVIGDGNVQVAADVTFWSATWASDNTLSGGPAPDSFKGFASDTNEPPTCSAWTADPGNSGPPPDQVPAYMGVIVSSTVSQSGSIVSGDTVEIIVVKTDPGFKGNPGHAGTGTVVASPSDPTKPAVFCHV